MWDCHGSNSENYMRGTGATRESWTWSVFFQVGIICRNMLKTYSSCQFSVCGSVVQHTNWMRIYKTLNLSHGYKPYFSEGCILWLQLWIKTSFWLCHSPQGLGLNQKLGQRFKGPSCSLIVFKYFKNRPHTNDRDTSKSDASGLKTVESMPRLSLHRRDEEQCKLY